MATLLLAAAGSALGGVFGGAAALVGQVVGAAAGYVLDRALLHSTLPSASGPRLSDLEVLSSTEGADIPRVYGRVRLAGELVWATNYEETRVKTGGKGGPTVKQWRYHANFAVALCEGPIRRVGRIWADGELLDTTAITLRVHLGDETQEPDPLILAKQGGAAPAYRGVAYVVFERLSLESWGNRIPQLSFEVIRVVDRLEDRIGAVTVIPGSTEFGYATTPVTRTLGPGRSASENRHVVHAETDFVAALDELQDLCPNLKRIALVVSWFGDDLRAGHCRVRPCVEEAAKATKPLVWSVSGIGRGEARVVSRFAGAPAYGGTPSDATVKQAIAEIRARGLEVVLYPFLTMDIPAGNGLADPLGGAEQPAHPWRGRITCDPAPGRPLSPDGSAEARSQIEAFVGACTPADFAATETGVAYSGAPEWSFRRLVLHSAHLAVAAGGVDGFLIGSEFVGLGRVRGEGGSHPFVEALVALAADVRSILGPSTEISYGADWSEWNGFQPADGSGDVIFHLDPLWASPDVDFVGIDAYFPLTDWRRGDHLDRALADLPTDRAHLAARVAGGEAYDWYYADAAGRLAQERLPIEDGAYAKPWVFRPKDLLGWWSNRHFDRHAGVEVATPTAWVPAMKPIRLTELGCPAVDLGANQPNLFPDPKSSESGRPWFSIGTRDDLVQRRTLEAVIDHWDPALNPAGDPISPVYGGPMVDGSDCQLWTWDARPFPAFPTTTEVWSDGDHWATGHWLAGRLGGTSLEALIAALLADHGVTDVTFRAVAGHLDGWIVDRRMTGREALAPLLSAFQVDAVDTGTGLHVAGRARRPDMTLTPADCVEEPGRPLVEIRRTQESELPREVSVTFSDASLDHRRATVSSRRLDGTSARVAAADLAAVAPVETMVGVADTWLADVWAGRTTVAFALDPTRVGLEPGDIVDVAVEGRIERVLVEAVTDGTARRIEARSIDPTIYGPVRGAPRARRGIAAAIWGDPAVVVLDIARFEEATDLHRPRLAAFADPWPGELSIWRRLDPGSWAAVGSLAHPATMGATVSALAPGPAAVWDRVTTLDVTLWGGGLAAASDALVLAGANRAAVQAPGGLWEVFQFAEAELVAPATWRLSRLLRVQGGSEDVWDGLAAIPAGAPFVLLDEAIGTLPVEIEDLGGSATFRIGPALDDYTRITQTEITVAPTGRGLAAWSPAGFRAHLDPGTGDVVFAWIRRSRSPGADAWNAGDVPLPEGTEAWRLEIRRDGDPVRSVDLAATTWTWTYAQRLADVGAGPLELAVRVAQVAPVVGARLWRGLTLSL